mmetsp:Transcript_83208/g.174167  ORF Transcript_83208/g.174167 Transcript_83208/m.174167 type:complete len:119 (-) Transcript_83208:83-439(-)|eukprot:CAMPEP_0206574544 /NCGR_PEP_ID=MMETSP0325_2-20121206/29513_1 /ASSEMBLY_ACC=CAM_ASM_000347 /TAXON_ID=2866 /ORGANISM="Crypthecodinium cohnii, Strain Seligo" /LENGTH=118 /DNA_ID=CAMNT_0054079177 /DNA_START=160 /DNA_END=516 /DNA_ORIENTATION=-
MWNSDGAHLPLFREHRLYFRNSPRSGFFSVESTPVGAHFAEHGSFENIHDFGYITHHFNSSTANNSDNNNNNKCGNHWQHQFGGIGSDVDYQQPAGTYALFSSWSYEGLAASWNYATF